MTSNIVIQLFLVLLYNSSFGQSPSNDPHWELTKNWNFKTMSWSAFINDWNISPCAHALDHKEGNVEPQYYLPGNVSLNSDGVHLTAKNQTNFGKIICYEADTFKLSDGLDNLRSTYYTSGSMETKPIHYKKYGFIEAKIKAPYGYNFFPAFWTLVGDNIDGVNAAEIDIFEFLPGNPYIFPLYPNNNTIVGTNVHLNYTSSDPKRGLNISSVSYTNFNFYAIEWTPSRITWYINNKPVRTLDNPGVHDFVKVIINLALNPWNSNNSLTTLPSDLVIEYVKFYDYKKDCSTIVNTCWFNFSTYNNMVKKEIIIGGNGCSNGISSTQNAILRASDGITIKGVFTVPIGGQLYLDANNCY